MCSLSAQMAIFCGICLPAKILVMEFSKNETQIETSIVGLCWVFQLSQQAGLGIVDISLLLVSAGRCLLVYKTHLALAIRTNTYAKVSIILAILLYTFSKAVSR